MENFTFCAVIHARTMYSITPSFLNVCLVCQYDFKKNPDSNA